MTRITMNAIQPDTVQYGKYAVRFIKSESINICIDIGDVDIKQMNIPQEAVLVEITPPIIDNKRQFVIGIGIHSFEAKTDAFERARKLIVENQEI